MKQIFLYIIVPFYNVGRYFAECLDSILAQSFGDFELVLVDDRGSDGSLNIAKEYEKRDSRIKIIQNAQNLGIGKSRNEGVRYALKKEFSADKKIFFGFVDSDDVIHKDYFRNLLRLAAKTNAPVARSGSVKKFKHKKYKKSIFRRNFDFSSLGRILLNFFSTTNFSPTCKKRDLSTNLSYATQVWRGVYDAGLFLELLSPESRHSEDVPFGICANALCMDAVGFVPFALDARYFYRQREGSITNPSRDVKAQKVESTKIEAPIAEIPQVESPQVEVSIQNYIFVYEFFKRKNWLEKYPIPPHLIIADSNKIASDLLYLTHLKEFILRENLSKRILELNPVLQIALDCQTNEEYAKKSTELRKKH